MDKCPDCGGSGDGKCPVGCEGTSCTRGAYGRPCRIEEAGNCKTCTGRGHVMAHFAEIGYAATDCRSCNGTGHKKISKCCSCNGTGKTNIHQSHYGEECHACKGVGRITDRG